MGFQSYRLPARKRSKHSKTFQTLQTLQNPPNPPTTVPSRDPRAKATSRTGTPQQWLSIGFQSCRLPARKRSKRSKTLQTLQNRPNPPNTLQHPPNPPNLQNLPPSKTLPTLQNPPNPPNTFPNRHPRAKATAMAFYRLSKLPFASLQTLQTFQTLQTLQTLQNAPNPPNTLPSKHPRAKATSRTGTPGPRPQQWLSMGFQSCRLPACKRSKPSKIHETFQTLQNPPAKPSKHPPPSRHPRAKATSRTGIPGSRPQQWLSMGFKAAVCQPANAPNIPKLSKPSKPSKTLQTLSPAGTPGPRPLPEQAPQQQWLSMGFQSCRLPARKRSKPSKTLQTLQTLQNPPNPPNTLQNRPNPPNTFPSRHPRAKATSPTGTPGPRPQQWLSMGFQSCRLPARKRSKPSKTFQTLQTLQNLPNPPNTVPSRHPRAKATSRTGTPGPRPQQWLSIGFQSCRLPARKRSKPSKPSKPSKLSKTLQTLQTPSPAGTPGPRPLPEQAPQGQGHSYGLSKLPFASPQTLQTLQNPANPPNPPKPSKPSKHPPKPSKPSKHPPQQAPQGQGHFPNRHPRAKATA